MFCILIVIFGCFGCLSSAPFFEESTNKTVCNSEQCLEMALYLSYAMDTTKNPCDNFYDFVCGRYVKQAVIPPGEGKIDLIGQLAITLDDNLERLILENIGIAKTKATRLVTELYRNCIFSHGDYDSTLASVKNTLNVLGGWPVLGNGDWSHINWENVSYISRRLGVNDESFIKISVHYDINNNTKYQIQLLNPTFLMSQTSLQEGLSNPDVQAYQNNIINLAQRLGASDLEYTKGEIIKLIEFESQLAKIAIDSEVSFLTVDELEVSYPDIPWFRFIIQMLGVDDVIVSKQDKIIIESISFIRDLNILLRDTDPITLASYIQFRAAEVILSLGGVSFGGYSEKVSKFPFIAKPKIPNLEYPRSCLKVILLQLPHALSSMYARKYMNSEIKNDIDNIVVELKKVFMSTMEENQWFDTQTKENAIRKLVAMVSHAAYPYELFDDTILDEYYENVDVDRNYINFRLKLRKFNFDNDLGKYNQNVNKSDWKSHSAITVVNAYHMYVENSLQILAGILQNPMFRKENPTFVNFAAIGFIIGHEITHGFDTTGSQFNDLGLAVNWFSEESLKEYVKRTQCIYEEYLAVNHNATISAFTLNEDISDVGGILLAYDLYQKWVANNYVEGSLPGLNYTPNQLFWMFYSRVWCAKETEDYINNVGPFDPHSRDKYRGLIPLTNSPDFAKDFNCPVGTFMNPETKCKVW